jgi:hypothetical protein
MARALKTWCKKLSAIFTEAIDLDEEESASKKLIPKTKPKTTC